MAGGIDSEDTYIAADVEFHLVLAEATRNPLVLSLMDAVREHLRAAFGTVFRVPGSAEQSVAEHRAIARAVELEDGPLARELMGSHIGRVQAGYETTAERIGARREIDGDG